MNSDYSISTDTGILVTGANGFIGTKVVEKLLERGYTNIRSFVRPSSSERLNRVLEKHKAGNSVEVVTGDLLAPEDCRKAVEGIAVILHLAAGVEKSFAGAFAHSAVATRNLLDAFASTGLAKRFVNISSFAVYSNLEAQPGTVLDETCPTETAPQSRFDAYCFGKLKQEEIVREYADKFRLPYVILRPGSVFGPGKKDITGRVGTGAFGVFLQVAPAKRLPLCFVDNCADAIVLAAVTPGIDGETFNVVDNDLPTTRQFLTEYRTRVKLFAIPIPYWLAYAGSVAWERYSRFSRGQLPPVFNRHRCAAEWKPREFSNRKLSDRMGWKPRVNMSDAMAAFLAQFNN